MKISNTKGPARSYKEHRNGFVHPSVNAKGGETIGYQVQRDGRGNYRMVNGVVASMVVVDWSPSYQSAVRQLRKGEREAWKGAAAA